MRRLSSWIVLCLAAGCFDTHEASLGEQEHTEADAHAPEAGQPGEDAGRSPLDAGPAVEREADAQPEAGPGRADAATSLLCRFEPWHCRDAS